MTNRMPAEAFPPGEFLRDELDARGWTQTEFAKLIERPVRLVNEIIHGKRGVSPETALDFAAAFGTSPQYWLNLESSYQLFKAGMVDARTGRDTRIGREARLREAFPVRELVKRGWVEASENVEVFESRVLSFFGVRSVGETPQFAHAAKRNYEHAPSILQQAWLFRVRQLATALVGPNYSESGLRAVLGDLETLTGDPEEIRHVPGMLAQCGVRFVIVEPLPGSKIDGACFWIDGGKTPVIGLTLLHDRIDNFWFVLRHEIEHVLRGDGRTDPVVDVASEDGELTSEAGGEAEAAANAAASDFCVPHDQIENFIARVDPMYSHKKVLGFANRIRRHPGLVVGQLHHRTGRYELFRKYLVKVRDIISHSALTDGFGRMGPADF
ncbi:HigA family addiction module antitoxin [Maricaulis sp.]|uniref:HigA family addiction module antitoxin n=1 Tax=Maricaulis sp. TaxID=1486257 RepID=UPI003A951325